MPNTTTTCRFLPSTTTALAGVALVLSTWTACQSRGDSNGAAVDSAVQGERSTEAKQRAPSREEGEQKTQPVLAPNAAAGTPAAEAAPQGEKAGGQSSSVQAEKPQTSSDEPPQVKRLVIASDVHDREPVALTGAASAGEPLTAFVELANGADAPAEVIVTFEHADGKKVGFVELSVPASSPRYRTWARTRNIRTAGTWHAVVTHKGGDEIARQSFTVEAPSDEARSPEAATAAAGTAKPGKATAGAGESPEET